jgi:hypothetical protein
MKKASIFPERSSLKLKMTFGNKENADFQRDID